MLSRILDLGPVAVEEIDVFIGDTSPCNAERACGGSIKDRKHKYFIRQGVPTWIEVSVNELTYWGGTFMERVEINLSI